MKQLKEKEEQVSTMNDHIKLLNEELKRIKNQNIKLYNYIQIIEKEGKKIKVLKVATLCWEVIPIPT